MSQLTKRLIQDSFQKLLEDRPLDKITIKDIVEACGINRGTFYYYYSDIFALMEEVFDNQLRTIVDAPKVADSWPDALNEAIQFARESRKQLYHAYNSSNKEKLEHYFSEIAEHFMRNFVEQEAEGLHPKPEDKAVIIHFYTCSIVRITLEWVDSGMKGTPEADIQRLGHLLHGSIRCALARSSAEN